MDLRARILSPAVVAWLILLPVFLCFFAFATFGTGHLLQPTLGTPFDSLAVSFLKGEVSVPDGAVIYENIRVGGKNVIYFGPFPAFLRIPLLLVFPSTFGKLSPLLSTLGGLFSAGAFLVIFCEAFGASRSVFRRFYAMVFTLIFSLGTPLLYLVAVPTIYQESILWALGFSLWSIAICYRAHRRGWSTRLLVLLSTCVAGAIFSRITFALPLCGLVVGAVYVSFLRHPGAVLAGTAIKRLLLVALPLVLAGSFTLWYNSARFGSPLTFLSWKGYEMESQAVVQKRAELGTFNARRIPFSFGEYLGIHKDYLSSSFPFISPWSPARGDRPNLYFSDSSEAMVSLGIASPVLLFFGLFGVVALCRSRFSGLTWAALVFSGQVALICSWYFITFRYTVEFLPFFLVLTLATLEGELFAKYRRVRIALLCVGVLSIVTMAVTVPRVVMFQTGIPPAYRQMLIQTLGTGR